MQTGEKNNLKNHRGSSLTSKNSLVKKLDTNGLMRGKDGALGLNGNNSGSAQRE